MAARYDLTMFASPHRLRLCHANIGQVTLSSNADAMTVVHVNQPPPRNVEVLPSVDSGRSHKLYEIVLSFGDRIPGCWVRNVGKLSEYETFLGTIFVFT